MKKKKKKKKASNLFKSDILPVYQTTYPFVKIAKEKPTHWVGFYRVLRRCFFQSQYAGLQGSVFGLKFIDSSKQKLELSVKINTKNAGHILYSMGN